MKNTKLFYVLIVAIILTTIVISCKNNDDTPDADPVVRYEVTATMNTDALLAIPPSPMAIDGTAFVNFGQPASIPNADFTTELNVNDEVIWSGTTATLGHRIFISRIVATTAVNFFAGSAPIPGLPVNEYGLIVASGNPGESMPYLIFFMLEVSGTLMTQEYFTDPKIRIR